MEKFAEDWIWTADLLCRKQPLYQLNLVHCLKTPVFGLYLLLTVCMKAKK